jgi:hypothetical protein
MGERGVGSLCRLVVRHHTGRTGGWGWGGRLGPTFSRQSSL